MTIDPAIYKLAQEINDSDALMAVYAAPEWDSLHDDGKMWVAALVNETLKRPPFPRPNISVEQINALPVNIKRYIMYLESECDHSGTIRSEMYMREDLIPALQARIKELESAPSPINPSHRGKM